MSIDKSSKLAPAISVRQLKAARALLAWSQADLAHHSGVSEPTIARLEAEDGGLGGRPSTAAKILDALLTAGIEFIPDQGDGTGVRLSSKTEIELSSAQCRGARAMLGWNQDDLAKAAFVGMQTVADFERGARMPNGNDLASMRLALERAGIEFLPPHKTGSGWGIRFAGGQGNTEEHGYDNGQTHARNQGVSVSSNDIYAGQSKMARVALGWGVRDLAKRAGVSPDTIARLERGEQLKSSTLHAVRTAFEAAGIEFIPENGGGPGVRAPKRKD